MKTTRFVLMTCIGSILIGWFGAPGDWNRGAIRARLAWAQESWRTEFDDVCSRTQDAMVLTQDELKDLVGRCDRLKPQIETLDESQKKVYLKRLGMCRDLYIFVLESRENSR